MSMSLPMDFGQSQSFAKEALERPDDSSVSAHSTPVKFVRNRGKVARLSSSVGDRSGLASASVGTIAGQEQSPSLPIPVFTAGDIGDLFQQDSESSDSEAESGVNTRNEKANDGPLRKRNRDKTSPHSETGGTSQNQQDGKRKRRVYTDQEYQMIIHASDDGQRKVLAKAIGMPWQTARNMMLRYRQTGKERDVRHDAIRYPDNGSHKKSSPYDEEHIGKWGKVGPRVEAHLYHLVHFDCAMTLEALKEHINRELIREFLIKNTELPESAGVATEQSARVDHARLATDGGAALGIRPLLPKELEAGGPLEVTAFEGNEDFRNFCSTRLIKSVTTIKNHLDKMSYSLKSIIEEKSTANTHKAKEKRLRMACLLKHLADGSLPGMEKNACMFFQDEMPFYLNQHRNRGWARKGERAVYKGVPVSKLAFRTQLAMVVHPTLGLFCAKQFNPEFTTKKKDGTKKKKASWSSGFTSKDFQSFVYLFMSTIITGFEDPAVKSELEDSVIYLFLDGAPEHGKGKLDEIKNNYPAKAKFDAILEEHHSSFETIKLSPNSPHLNLCEFYNREMRARVDRERNDPSVHRIMQITAESGEVETGQLIQTRINTLKKCIDKALNAVMGKEEQNSGPSTEKQRDKHMYARGHYNNWNTWVNRVIDARGHLNYYQPM